VKRRKVDTVEVGRAELVRESAWHRLGRDDLTPLTVSLYSRDRGSERFPDCLFWLMTFRRLLGNQIEALE
jgi:hypothetical protein